MTDDRTLAAFRTQVAMLRRQRWQQVEYSEDPPVALLFAEADAQNRGGGRGFSMRSSARQDTWRKVWVNDAGRVMQENVDPPAEEPEEAAAEPAPETASPPAEKPKAPPAEPVEPAQAAAKPPAARARKTPAKAAKADTPPEPEAETAPAKPARKPARPKKES